MNKYQFYPQPQKSSNNPNLNKTITYAKWGGAALVFGFCIYIYFSVFNALPSLEQLENPPQEFATKILDNEGNLIENFFIKRRMYVPYDSIPKSFVDALVATEDKEFYNHWGVHVSRIVKAALKNVFAFRAKEGASTITQQLARNLYFTQEQTLTRKIKEAITAVQIEKTYTKNEIIEMYSNTVNFGRGAYGIQVAARVYFGKPPYKLTTSECAYLVAVLKAPANYDVKDPDNYKKGLTRRNTVLALMAEQGMITPNQKAKYSEEPIELNNGQSKFISQEGIAPHFVEMIRKKLSKDSRLEKYDLYRDGLTISTTLNLQIQKYANEAVAEQLAAFQKEFDSQWSWNGKQQLLSAILTKAAKESPEYIAATEENVKNEIIKRLTRNDRFADSVKRAVTTVQCAVTVIEPATGAILAMVGASPLSMSRSSSAKYSLNHCTETKRQPGSAFKPFVYASAMAESHLSAESSIDAGGFTYTLPSGEKWSPKGGKEGSVALSTALKFSINSVAARLITQNTSPAKVVALAKKMGITTPMDPYPALALGVEEVYPLDLTASYIAFVNQGIAVSPVGITKIENNKGNIIYQNKLPVNITDALDPKLCKQMMNMMRGVVDGGTASTVRRYFSYDAAGKTGTTNDYADAWFIGFTPQLVAGVWLGFDDHRIKFTGTYGMGGKAAAPIWGRLMSKIYNDEKLGYRQKMFPGRDSTIQKIAPEDAKIINEDSVPMDSANTDDSNHPTPSPEGDKPKQHQALNESNDRQQKKFIFPSIK